MSTARNLINRAFRKARVIVKSETPDADEAADALEDLRGMISSWGLDPRFIYARQVETFNLVGGQEEYTIGPGGDFDTSRPNRVVEAFVRSGNIDYPLTLIGDVVYADIIVKDINSIPASLNYSNSFPLAKIRIYPSPASAYQLFLYSEKTLQDFSTLDTVVSLPPGWEDAIVYNLALRLASEYGQPVDSLMAELARSSLALIRSNIEKVQVSFNRGPGVIQRNIYTGWYT